MNVLRKIKSYMLLGLLLLPMTTLHGQEVPLGKYVYARIDASQNLYLFNGKGTTRSLKLAVLNKLSLSNNQLKLVNARTAALIVDSRLVVIDNTTMTYATVPLYAKVTNIIIVSGEPVIYFIDSLKLFQYDLGSKAINEIADLGALKWLDNFRLSSFAFDKKSMMLYFTNFYSTDNVQYSNNYARRLGVYNITTKEINILRNDGNNVQLFLRKGKTQLTFIDEGGLAVMDPEVPHKVTYLVSGRIYDLYDVLDTERIAFSMVSRDNLKGVGIVSGVSVYDNGKVIIIEKESFADTVAIDY